MMETVKALVNYQGACTKRLLKHRVSTLSISVTLTGGSNLDSAGCSQLLNIAKLAIARVYSSTLRTNNQMKSISRHRPWLYSY